MVCPPTASAASVTGTPTPKAIVAPISDTSGYCLNLRRGQDPARRLQRRPQSGGPEADALTIPAPPVPSAAARMRTRSRSRARRRAPFHCDTSGPRDRASRSASPSGVPMPVARLGDAARPIGSSRSALRPLRCRRPRPRQRCTAGPQKHAVSRSAGTPSARLHDAMLA